MEANFNEVEVLHEVLLGKNGQIKKVSGNDKFLEAQIGKGWTLLQEFGTTKLVKNKEEKSSVNLDDKLGIFVKGFISKDGKIVEREILIATGSSEKDLIIRLKIIADEFKDGRKFDFLNFLEVVDGFGIRELEK